MSARDSGYGVFGGAYDVFNADVDYGGWADFAEQCFDRFLPRRPAQVLDLACGTGKLTRELARRGYRMTGVDLSPDMLALAASACPAGTLLLCQDMRTFELIGTAGAVVCSLDSVNHLSSRAGVEACFRRVHTCLDTGGLFLFDVNTRFRFEREYGDNAYQYDGLLEDGRAACCCWQNDYNAKTRLCRFYLTVFTETRPGSGLYSRRDADWSERYYSLRRLEGILKDSGFEPCGVFGGTDMSAPSPEDTKMYIAARAIK